MRFCSPLIVLLVAALLPSFVIARIGNEATTKGNDGDSKFWLRMLQNEMSISPTASPLVPTASPIEPPTLLPTASPVEPPTPRETPAPVTPTLEPTRDPPPTTIEPLPTGPPSTPSTGAPVQPQPPSLAPTFGPNTCDEVCIDVRQGGETIRVVKPVETLDNISDFYNYIPSQTSFQGTGVIPTVTGTSQIMIHGNGAICELSVLIVHDSRNNGKDGGQVNMTISGDLSDAIVKDDPERERCNDQYVYNETADETNIRWRWASCCTDGVADVVSLDSNVLFVRGIDRWVYVAGPLNSIPATNDDYIDLGATQTLEMCRADCSRFSG